MPVSQRTVIGVGILVVLAIAGFWYYTSERQRQEKHTSLTTAIPVAMAGKQAGDWRMVITALEKPLQALGAENHPNRALADALLSEARTELAHRAAAAAASAKTHADETERALKWETSWLDRAAAAAKKTCDELADELLAKTHPTGKNPALVFATAGKTGDNVVATMRIQWQGGITNASYTTEVVWTFNRGAHVSAVVTSDNSAIAVNEPHKKLLDEFFRDKVYPGVKGAADRR